MSEGAFVPHVDPDQERTGRDVASVYVADAPEPGAGALVFAVGFDDVTAITFGSTNGHMAPLQTVKVWKDEHLHGEFIFANCKGVTYRAQA